MTPVKIEKPTIMNANYTLGDLEQLFTSRMQQYEDKLQRATSSSNSTHPDLASLAVEFAEFKSFVWQALNTMKMQLDALNSAVDRHETAMRRKVLLLHGVPEKPSEKLPETVLEILKTRLKLSEASTNNSIHVCHRLGTSQQKARPILVRFFTMEHRQLVWDNKKLLKGSGITVSEFLTRTRHVAFMAARKHFGINNCWTIEGKIVVVSPDMSRHKLETMDELRRLTARFPMSAGDDSVPSEQLGSPKEPDAPAKGLRKARRRN